MKIAIDCRYYGKSGIGRFLEGILERLDYDSDEYFFVGSKEILDRLPYKFTPIYTDVTPFSMKGLFEFPTKQVNKCDAFFSPNFIIPFGIKSQIFTTIHDVIFLDFKDSNNGFLDYRIKKFFLSRAIKKSNKVFTVSNFTKSRIVKHFDTEMEKKIVITGNGITESMKKIDITAEKSERTLIYVGNIKKHKGLHVLCEALKILNSKYKKYRLIIAGTRENFRTADNSDELFERSDVVFTGYLSESELVNAISSAEFLIQPSFYEGFGITPLEALYFGTKPIISNIEVFEEVYSDFNDVRFFRVGDPNDLAIAIQQSSGIIKDCKSLIDSKFSYGKYARIITDTIKGREQ